MIVGNPILLGAGSSDLTTKTINTNGTYNAADDGADGYSSVTVNVSGGGTLVTKNITSNGTYNAVDDSADGYSSVVVNVSGGGGTTILSGTTAPTSGQGSDGQIYLHYLGRGIKNAYGQFINTGYNGNNNSKYEIGFMLTEALVGQYPSPFGARSEMGSVTNSTNINLGNNGNYGVTFYGWGSDQAQAFNFGGSSLINKYVVAELSAGAFKMTVDGVENTFTFTPSLISSTTPIGIFGQLVNGELGAWSPINGMILFGFKIYENDVLVHDFVPALDDSNIPCVYDEVAHEYKYNGGSGSFVYMGDESILKAFVKVNGAWQNLIGSSINDVGGD